MSLAAVGEYNILRDPQLAAQGLLPAVACGFAGEPTTLSPIRYDPARSVADLEHGVERWVRAIIYPVQDDAARVREVVVQHEDVTELVLAQGLLEERVALRKGGKLAASIILLN